MTHNVILPQSLVAKQNHHLKRNKLVAKGFNNFYDILTIFISIADVTTDLMVLVSFYSSNRMTFFWISFSILLVAQIGYLIVFMLSFELGDFIENLFNVCSCECKFCHSFLECLCRCYAKCKCKCKCDCDCECNSGPLCDNNSKICKICDKFALAIAVILVVIVVAVAAVSLFVCLLPFGHLVSFLMYFAENEESAFAKCLRNKVGIKKRTNIPLKEHWSDMAKFTAKKINKHGIFYRIISHIILNILYIYFILI